MEECATTIKRNRFKRRYFRDVASAWITMGLVARFLGRVELLNEKLLRSWLYHVPRLINSNGQWKFIYNGTILRMECCERWKENKTGEICRAQLSSGSWKQWYSSRSTTALERRCSACELWPTFIPAFLESKTRPKNEEYSTRIAHSLECDWENGSR